ncbi:ABC transporter permease [Pseudochelatococcus sp. B33]
MPNSNLSGSLQEATEPGWHSAAAPRSQRAARSLSRAASALLPIGVVVIIISAWSLAIVLFRIPSYILPAPSSVLTTILDNKLLIVRHSLSTLTVIALGFLISVVVGITAAVLVVMNRTIERALMPIIIGSQTIPKVAIAPLLVVWLGFGIEPKVAVTFLISFFPIVVSTITGLKAVESEMLELVRSMGAGSLRTVFLLRIPTALPQVLSGLKLGITAAVVGAVVAEFVGSDSGLGYLLLTSTAVLDGPMVWAALLVLVAIGVLLFAAIIQLERLLIPWHVSIRTENQ